MSAILLAVNGPQVGDWQAALRAQVKGRELRVWPETGAPDEIDYACVWLPPRGVLAELPRLKAVINLGAGVDHLLADPTLPEVPLARVAHPDLTMRVTEYVVLHVLIYHRRQRLYDAQQRQRQWRVHDQPAAGEVAVGIMGLGVIGRAAALALAGLGFRVAGFSRTSKRLPGVDTFHGTQMIDAFLAELANRRGEMRAEVTAAQSLSEGQKQALAEAIRRSVGGKIATASITNWCPFSGCRAPTEST